MKNLFSQIKFPLNSKINKISVFESSFFLAQKYVMCKQAGNLSFINAFFAPQKFYYSNKKLLGQVATKTLLVHAFYKDGLTVVKRNEFTRIQFLVQLKNYFSRSTFLAPQCRKKIILFNTPAGFAPKFNFLLKKYQGGRKRFLAINCFYQNLYTNKNLIIYKNGNINSNFIYQKLTVQNTYLNLLNIFFMCTNSLFARVGQKQKIFAVLSYSRLAV